MHTMLKWIIGLSILLAAEPGLTQQPTSPPKKEAPHDTVRFSFDMADWHCGDTVFLHSAAPTATLRRFYNKNLRGIYHGDTPVVGSVILSFYVDNNGKFTGSCYEDSSTSAELNLEVLRVTNRLSQLVLIPTAVAGTSFASKVRLKVIFQKASDTSPSDQTGDLIVNLYEVMH
jgi:TonB family protein